MTKFICILMALMSFSAASAQANCQNYYEIGKMIMQGRQQGISKDIMLRETKGMPDFRYMVHLAHQQEPSKDKSKWDNDAIVFGAKMARLCYEANN